MDVVQIVLLVLMVQILLGVIFFIGFKVGKNTCNSFQNIGYHHMIDSDMQDNMGVDAPKVSTAEKTKEFIARVTMSQEEKIVAEKIKQINKIKEDELNNIMEYTGMIEGEEKEGDG